MRPLNRILLVAIATILLLGVGTVSARSFKAPSDDVSAGAQLYDRWYAAIGVSAPDGNMPLWGTQTTNTRSGPDTWRCSECHGWDYQGADGAYRSGSHATGFPNLMTATAGMSTDEIVATLKGSKEPAHDFSSYLDDKNLEKLARFLKEGVLDDSFAIDHVTLKTKGGNLEHGKKLYDETCVRCHGADGKLIIFRTEGVNEYLGSVANRDPYRFLHRTRFGVAGTEMPIGRELGWKPADGVDVLAYAQSLPSGMEQEPVANAGAGSEPPQKLGGPASGVFGGMLTGLGAVLGMVGISALFLFTLIVIGVLVVWALRKRQ